MAAYSAGARPQLYLQDIVVLVGEHTVMVVSIRKQASINLNLWNNEIS